MTWMPPSLRPLSTVLRSLSGMEGIAKMALVRPTADIFSTASLSVPRTGTPWSILPRLLWSSSKKHSAR